MILALLIAAATADAAVAGLRDLCPDRPGRLTPACIVDDGHLLVEGGAVDFTHDTTASGTTDTVAVANVLLRYGVTHHLEVFAGWTPYVHARTRHGGGATATDGVGDVMLGFKQSLLHPGGTGFSLAVQPFVVVPTAKPAIGVGSTVAGVVVPVTIALPADFALGLSPEIDRIADAGARGHHASYTLIGGIGRQFGSVNAGVELAGVHNDDPTGRTTQATFDVYGAFVAKAHPTVQFDAAVYVGLNRDTPDIELLAGVSKRF